MKRVAQLLGEMKAAGVIGDFARRREDWQKTRAGLPYGEKIRMAARLRDATLALRRPPAPGTANTSPPGAPSRGR